MNFLKGDRVVVAAGGLKGRAGRIVELVGQDHIKVKLVGIRDPMPFMESELVLNEVEMVKVYGGAFGVIAGLKKS